MPVWLKEKLYLKTTLKRELASLGNCRQRELPPLLFAEHHQSHAASAFYFSPFDRAAVLCLDGVGEWATTSTWVGHGKELKPLWEIDFPHSLGLLYSAFTYFTGFRVNSGEYKLMGLAPYGRPIYEALIRDKLIDLQRAEQIIMNLKIKYRESFRSFAPAVLAHRVADYFEHEGPVPTFDPALGKHAASVFGVVAANGAASRRQSGGAPVGQDALRRAPASRPSPDASSHAAAGTGTTACGVMEK